MSETNPTLTALFTDIADAIREKIGGIATIVADDFPDVIRERLQAAPPATSAYLTFSSPSSFTLKVNDATKHWNGTLEYSTNTSTWSTWDGTTTLSSATSGSDNVLYLRGTGNTVITGSNSNYKWVLTGSDIACIGNIENLLDYATVQSGAHPTMASGCYTSMFSGCTSLTQAPALPATTLKTSCYQSMFQGCTRLTQVSTLPATMLEVGCYQGMFLGCTSLTQAPALPATTLANYCYYNMFFGCTGLTQAPALPATTLATSCYYAMFRNCTSLTQAPALSATTLASNCYRGMFLGCTSLTQAPALPATTLASGCYASMFQGCTKIKLSSTRTGEYTQEYRIPPSGTGTTATDALSDMFTDTGGTFTGTPEINKTYYFATVDVNVNCLTFSSPNSFTLKVNDATKHWDGTLEYSTNTSTWSTWDGTTTLSSATSGSDNILYLRGAGNTVITGRDSNYKWVLTGSDISCIGNIEYLLDYATVESGAHPTMENYCYQHMFQGCTSLTQAPSLPATTLRGMCYAYMFSGCTSLTQAPALPATTLKSTCYAYMFQGCTGLKLSSTQTGEYTQEYRIPSSGTGTTAINALTDMFASTGGTFTGTPEINTTYYLSNTNTVVG